MTRNRNTIRASQATHVCSPRWFGVLALALSSLSLSGCAGRFIVFTTGTVIGIEATAEEGAEQRLVLGYKRFEGAFIPTRDDDGNILDESYSVYAALGLNAGFFTTSIHQVFATGTAAQTLAGTSAGLSRALTVSAAELGPLGRGETRSFERLSFAELRGRCADVWVDIRTTRTADQISDALSLIQDTLDDPGIDADGAATAIRTLNEDQLGFIALTELAIGLDDIRCRGT